MFVLYCVFAGVFSIFPVCPLLHPLFSKENPFRVGETIPGDYSCLIP